MARPPAMELLDESVYLMTGLEFYSENEVWMQFVRLWITPVSADTTL